MLAGKFWVALAHHLTPPGFGSFSKKIKSPQDFVTYCEENSLGIGAAPNVQAIEWLYYATKDSSDPVLIQAVLNTPGYPSNAQLLQVVNRVEREREKERKENILKNESAVDSWLSAHAGDAQFKKPPGWKWLKKGDGKSLCVWVAKSNACIVDRIISGNMDNFVGVLRGPKDEIVGIEIKDRYMYCLDSYACCDRNNNFDEAAWKWASVPQRMRTDEATRAARQERLRMRREAKLMKRRVPVGDSFAERRAEKRGDWLALDNPPKARPLRARGVLPNGVPFIWTSQR